MEKVDQLVLQLNELTDRMKKAVVDINQLSTQIDFVIARIEELKGGNQVDSKP